MLHFQKLDVYQRAIEFLALSRRIRAELPKGNADLADQLRRAAQSIPQNIAEGAGRATRADKANHYTARLRDGGRSSPRRHACRRDDRMEHYERGLELLERIVAMLTKLIDP